MPSQRIFLLRHRSQAWAILLCELDPTLITFIGNIPGILAMANECDPEYQNGISSRCGLSSVQPPQ
jgi:hypothetical protein